MIVIRHKLPTGARFAKWLRAAWFPRQYRQILRGLRANGWRYCPPLDDAEFARALYPWLLQYYLLGKEQESRAARIMAERRRKGIGDLIDRLSTPEGVVAAVWAGAKWLARALNKTTRKIVTGVLTAIGFMQTIPAFAEEPQAIAPIRPQEAAEIIARAVIDPQRSRTISQNESSRMWHKGRLEVQKDLGMLRRWNVAEDERVCPICLPLAGKAVKPDEYFAVVDGEIIWNPPAHTRCRCDVSTFVFDTAVAVGI